MFHGIPKQSGVLGKHHKFANKIVRLVCKQTTSMVAELDLCIQEVSERWTKPAIP